MSKKRRGVSKWVPPEGATGWARHKLCPDHGTAYLLIRDIEHPSQTGMCAHLTCIDKQLSALMRYPRCRRLIMFCRAIDRDKEFPSFAVEQLLKTAYPKKSKQNPDADPRITILSSFSGWYIALKFLAKCKKEEDYQKRLYFCRKEIKQMLEELATDAAGTMFAMSKTVKGNISGFNSSSLTPEELYSAREIVELINDYFGPEYYLFLSGVITSNEFRKITGMTVAETRDVRPRVAKFYKRMTR